jgi:hypothetical protein
LSLHQHQYYPSIARIPSKGKYDMAQESWTWVDWLPIAISLFAAVVAIVSAWVAWKAPQVAARLAEDLRQTAARADMKRWVFLTLMQQRATPFTEEAVRAFNMIDVVFVDAPTVREKWAMYLKSQDRREQLPPHERVKRLTELLAAMTTDIGLTGVGATDLERSYFPDYVRRGIKIQDMTRAWQEQELDRAVAEASANTTPQALSKP